MDVSDGPIDGLVQMTKVAGIYLVLLDEILIDGTLDAVGAHHVLQTFVVSGHVAVHAATAFGADGMMRVRRLFFR